jgi:hypothetical protein
MKYYGIQNEVKAYINRLQDENGIFVSMNDIKTINDRVESLKRSGVWSRFSLGFNDVDGDAYLTRAGVANPLGRCEVLWFTRGMKALDLWRSMVCWPMRSYQNKGTGSTVYSLGGVSSGLNGTFNNLPTWGVNGINFNSSPAALNQVRISPSTISSLVNEGNFMAMVTNQRQTGSGRLLTVADLYGSNRRIWIYTASTTAGGFSEYQHRNTIYQTGGIPASLNFTNDGQIVTRSTTGTSCTVRGVVNKTIRGSSTSTTTGFTEVPNAATTAFGSIFSSNEFTGTISYGILVTNNSDSNTWNLVNDLAKLTLGNGLGLP